MRLADEDTQLFLAVLPTFVEALPPCPGPALTGSHSNNPHDLGRMDLMNSITLLRFEIQRMQNVLTEAGLEYDLPDDDFVNASKALEDGLFWLEELVDDAILDCKDDPSVCTPNSQLSWRSNHSLGPSSPPAQGERIKFRQTWMVQSLLAGLYANTILCRIRPRNSLSLRP